MQQIVTALGAGSGIDTAQLVRDLVALERERRVDPITRRIERVESRIAAVTQLQAAVRAFASAMKQLEANGDFAPTVASSAPDIVRASFAGVTGPEARLTVSVNALAQGQQLRATLGETIAVTTEQRITVRYGALGRDVADGLVQSPGALPEETLTIAPGSYDRPAIAALLTANTSLAARIDASSGALVLSGPVGATNGFTVAIEGVAGPADTALDGLRYTPLAETATLDRSAGDASLLIDGARTFVPGNQLVDAPSGIRLQLLTTTTASVTVVATNNRDALASTVEEFVAAYNEMQSLVNALQAEPATAGDAGGLARDASALLIQRELAALLRVTGVGGASLAAYGVQTERSGALSVDKARLQSALARDPAALVDLFTRSGTGLTARIDALSSRLARTATLTYQNERRQLDADQRRAEAAIEAQQLRLGRQFAAMERQIAAYKASESLVKQQVDLLTADRSV